MDTRTGEIVPETVVQALRDQKRPESNFYKLIPEQYVPVLQAMNRKQRREWYRKNKNLFNKEAEDE